MNKKYLILVIILIFIVSVIIRYWPIYHKGFPSSFSAGNLILARNLAFANRYSFENEKNVILSSSLVEKEGVLAGVGNKLTPVIYGKVFNFLGFDQKIPLYLCISLYSLTTLLLFLLVLKLFNLKIALIFSAVDIFIPFILAGSVWFGSYEWAMLFFVAALLVYLWKKETNSWRLLISGLFFGLAILARNAFLISFLAFVLFDFYFNVIYKKKWREFKTWIWSAIKRIFIFVLPVLLLWFGFMAYSSPGRGSNDYLAGGDIGYNGHLFRDPYTYHFEKESFINQIKRTAQGDEINALIQYGYLSDWRIKVKMQIVSLFYYLNNFLRMPTIGGSLMIFFLILGLFFLYKKERKMFILFIFWVFILFSSLIFLRTTNADHFLEIRFPLVFLISLGVFMVMELTKTLNLDNRFKYLLIFGLLLVVLLELIQSDKWMFHENYENSNMEKRITLVEIINEQKDLNKGKDVIAVGIDDQTPEILNWYTDLSYIYFSPETIEKLLEKKNLQWAFDQFGVTKAMGYNKDMLAEIMKQTNVKIIDSNGEN